MKTEYINFHDQSGIGPFTLSFVYSPNGNFVFFGKIHFLYNYIEEHFEKAIVNLYFTSRGRSCWHFFCKDCIIQIHKPCKETDRKFVFTRNYSGKTLLKLRRIPKKWIPEYDKMIEEYKK